jgi:hypothetical protein
MKNTLGLWKTGDGLLKLLMQFGKRINRVRKMNPPNGREKKRR